mmetsp:Transcript_28113/g.65319  ORF Transcript_28113/g.65319 Transcript_28113/m.65319 type:complete len:239 (+) Transcript_28113:2237-2953(+)
MYSKMSFTAPAARNAPRMVCPMSGSLGTCSTIAITKSNDRASFGAAMVSSALEELPEEALSPLAGRGGSGTGKDADTRTSTGAACPKVRNGSREATCVRTFWTQVGRFLPCELEAGAAGAASPPLSVWHRSDSNKETWSFAEYSCVSSDRGLKHCCTNAPRSRARSSTSDNKRSATLVSKAPNRSTVFTAHISSMVCRRCASKSFMPPRSTNWRRACGTSQQASAIRNTTSSTSSDRP